MIISGMVISPITSTVLVVVVVVVVVRLSVTGKA